MTEEGRPLRREGHLPEFVSNYPNTWRTDKVVKISLITSSSVSHFDAPFPRSQQHTVCGIRGSVG